MFAETKLAGVVTLLTCTVQVTSPCEVELDAVDIPHIVEGDPIVAYEVGMLEAAVGTWLHDIGVPPLYVLEDILNSKLPVGVALVHEPLSEVEPFPP